jgi:hypothetical protein
MHDIQRPHRALVCDMKPAFTLTTLLLTLVLTGWMRRGVGKGRGRNKTFLCAWKDTLAICLRLHTLSILICHTHLLCSQHDLGRYFNETWWVGGGRFARPDFFICLKDLYRLTGTDRQTDRQTHRQTDRQAYKFNPAHTHPLTKQGVWYEDSSKMPSSSRLQVCSLDHAHRLKSEIGCICIYTITDPFSICIYTISARFCC